MNVSSTLYKIEYDHCDKVFKMNYKECIDGIFKGYYSYNRTGVEELITLGENEKFNIFKLKPIQSIPIVSKPVNNILKIQRFGENYDATIRVSNDSKIIIIPDKSCYIVETDKIEQFVFTTTYAICIINLKDYTGEILYPDVKYSVQFKFILQSDSYIKNNYVITEYMINNCLDTKTKIIPFDVYGDIYKRDRYSHYYIPVCFTYDGLYVPQPRSMISVIEENRFHSDYYEYTKRLIL